MTILLIIPLKKWSQLFLANLKFEETQQGQTKFCSMTSLLISKRKEDFDLSSKISEILQNKLFTSLKTHSNLSKQLKTIEYSSIWALNLIAHWTMRKSMSLFIYLLSYLLKSSWILNLNLIMNMLAIKLLLNNFFSQAILF